ncbi:MAG TPA: ATP-binding cassette domain-containing protein [Candidatus Marinimicrobia bacterium]|nr:ATP-binding cassette domain-containing protein [Candidatus Neomarinimicrobiota bacterium]
MITIENLTKYYGTVRAVDNISLQVRDGEILGFLGPNGAGKSTTLKILTTYLSPTSGTIRVNDYNIFDHSKEIREMIGYLPELNPLYDDLRVYDFLQFVAQSRQIDQKKFRSRLAELIELCGLKGVIHKNINELSKGYKQRVGLAQAIFHDPQILILDEPTTGLDPNQIMEIRELIRNLGREKTVIISTHILQEIQAIANRMVIINKGKLVVDGTIEEVMSGFRGQTRLNLELQNADETGIRQMMEHLGGMTMSEFQAGKNGITELTLEYAYKADPRAAIFDYAVKSQWKILEMNRHKISLEEVFRDLTVEGKVSNA